MRFLFHFLFWCAVAVTLYLTLRPLTVFVPGSDKTHHALTFGVLMALAGAAYPRSRPILLAVALSGFGAAIELVQPYFARSRDIWDWVADSVGIAVVLTIIVVLRTVGTQRG